VGGNQRWHSRSALGLDIDYGVPPAVGEHAYRQLLAKNGAKLYSLSYGIIWEDKRGKQLRYTFRVAENLDGFNTQIRRFRHSLWGWLGGAAILLLIVQGFILRWGLRPLRQVAEELNAIEAGRALRLSGVYPKELRGLTENLNALIANARDHLVRYRDSLGNLAHSLKTPLAVMRGAMENQASDQAMRHTVQKQVERMTQIVEYQLQRAATSGRTSLAAPIGVAKPARKILAALAKVYAGKSVQSRIDIGEDVVFHGDESDLLEVLGNLADNAFKWCRHRVEVSARMIPQPDRQRAILELRVEDDGPGILEKTVARVLKRGERADPATPGHGLGLAVVNDTVRLYGGGLSIERGKLGGAMLVVRM